MLKRLVKVINDRDCLIFLDERTLQTAETQTNCISLHCLPCADIVKALNKTLALDIIDFVIESISGLCRIIQHQHRFFSSASAVIVSLCTVCPCFIRSTYLYLSQSHISLTFKNRLVKTFLYMLIQTST